MTPFPAASGGKPTYWANSGVLGYSVIKQAPPERIKEILRVLNWLASPIGTTEYQLMTYGLKDTHWTPDDNGNPQLNARGKADALVPFRYITQGPVALYNPRNPDFAAVMQDAEKAMFPFVSTNAADGYYSPTSSSKYPGLLRALADTLNDVVVGRQPISGFDAAVKTFLEGGGDQMRGELEQAIAQGL
jgi:putative aldouronate transport system substrate-binding protein